MVYEKLYKIHQIFTTIKFFFNLISINLQEDNLAINDIWEYDLGILD